ncbi:hypothetical protein PR003_g12479 [Phytophthora rubi]|uniref:Uncharacterized protein n=1 Tax=Phytophthora rubi TaxID=129364 RepID=A0A6A3LZF3_9STRA|nr:hypothetical protein PR002_g12286 [Phytophthora rubi]KAE9036769.1 hypothetical protein PR001_g8671 [Phytophthora rubi]KAE9336498.1 hypothetical protein PR003_g12479 [Phytophthora rubi]
MQQQPMGEFMVLHAETNATSGSASSTRGQQMPIAAPTSTDEAKQEEVSKTKENEGTNEPHKKSNKRLRYLRDTERHNIIKRTARSRPLWGGSTASRARPSAI